MKTLFIIIALVSATPVIAEANQPQQYELRYEKQTDSYYFVYRRELPYGQWERIGYIQKAYTKDAWGNEVWRYYEYGKYGAARFVKNVTFPSKKE